MAVSISTESMIRGYHVYQDIWSSHINESLPCKRERHNLHDPFAVSVLKDADVVGHVPRKISTICYVFLGRPGSIITCKVTGTRRYSSDLPQGGMEIPCLLEFKGEQSVVEKARKLLNEKLNTCVPTTPTVAPAVSEPVKRASVNTTSIPVEKSTPGLNTIPTLVSNVSEPLKKASDAPPAKKVRMAVHVPSVVDRDYSIWVKFGKLVLTTSQREEIDHGERLKDYHINFAQEIIRSQFQINGLQSTLLQSSRKITCNKLQVIHSRGNHWIVASTILSDAGCVDVYDSLYDSLDDGSVDIITHLFGELKINMAPLKKQHGSSDCGLFAIASAVHLSKKCSPAEADFNQLLMRPHLIKCFEEYKMTRFPTY